MFFYQDNAAWTWMIIFACSNSLEGRNLYTPMMWIQLILHYISASNLNSTGCNDKLCDAGLKKLEKLNMRYCNCITDSDMKYLSGSTSP